jgi:hypothetical protein
MDTKVTNTGVIVQERIHKEQPLLDLNLQKSQPTNQLALPPETGQALKLTKIILQGIASVHNPQRMLQIRVTLKIQAPTPKFQLMILLEEVKENKNLQII